MRKLLWTLAVLLLAMLPPEAHARKQNSKADWRDVEGLAAGTPISVKTRHSVHLLCFFERATDTELSCEPLPPAAGPWPYGGPFPFPYPSRPSDYVFRREQVREVRLEHSQAANTLIGAGIAGTAGAGLGAARVSDAPGAGALVFGVIGFFIGGQVGRVSPLFHRHVIYRQP